MIILPRFIASLPVIRDKIYHPKIILRGDEYTGSSRYGVMPGGHERDYGSTVDWNLDQAKERYFYDLWIEYRIDCCAPVQVEGSDFSPLPRMPGFASPS